MFWRCGLAPVIMVDDDVHERVRAGQLMGILDKYRTATKGEAAKHEADAGGSMSEILANQQQLTEVRDAVRAERDRRQAAGVLPIRICMGASCIASGARARAGAS